MPVRRTDRFDEYKRFMIRAAQHTVTQAAEIINARAKEIITEKDFILTGTLRRSGHVERARVHELGSIVDGEVVTDVTVRATISFPLVYAPWIESGRRGDRRFGTVTMLTKEPGFLHQAAVEKAEDVHQFIAQSMANAQKAFR